LKFLPLLRPNPLGLFQLSKLLYDFLAPPKLLDQILFSVEAMLRVYRLNNHGFISYRKKETSQDLVKVGKF